LQRVCQTVLTLSALSLMMNLHFRRLMHIQT
jgi:hypothetical protein